jgi:predicted nucleotidyltransferase
MGFTRRESMTDKDFSVEQAARFTRKLKKAGELPDGVHAVESAWVSRDGKQDGEWKVFVSVVLIVEADSLADAEQSEPPEELLMKVADKMIRGDAESAYGVGRSFEQLEVEEYAEPLVVPKKRWVASQLRNNPYSRVSHKILDAFIVGSVAKGTDRPDSDLDIAVIIPESKRVSALQRTEQYHAKFTDRAQMPVWQGRRVDFQFFYANDPQLATFSKIPLNAVSA